MQQENRTTAAEDTTTTTTDVAAEPTSTPVAMLAGICAVITAAVGAAVWYLKRGRS